MSGYPIIPIITLEYVNQRINSSRAWIEKYHTFIHENPGSKRLQWAYSNLATHYVIRGSCEFAFEEFTNCKAFLACAATAWIEVFKLHGTTTIEFELDGRKEQKIDNSLSNSRELRTAIYCALVAKRVDIASELVRLDQTDEDSNFVSAASTIYSVEDKIFVSLMFRILSGIDVSPSDFRQLKTGSKELEFEKQLLLSIAETDGRTFENCALQFLAWHETFRLTDKYAWDPMYFACYPVAALCQLAKHRGLQIELIAHSSYATKNLIL